MLKELSAEQYVNDFLEALLDEAGMDTMSVEVREQMLKDLHARLQDRFFGDVVINLSESDLTEFRTMTDSGASQEKLEKFIEEHIPNAPEVFAKSMMTFRNDYLGVNA
jgi:hypothetical protein